MRYLVCTALSVFLIGPFLPRTAHAQDGTCTAQDLNKLVEVLHEVSDDRRGTLLWYGLQQTCPEQVDPDQIEWIKRVVGSPEADQEAALRARDAACPHARSAWDAPLSSWGLRAQELYSSCKLSRSGLLTTAEFQSGAAEAGVLGNALYQGLHREDEEHARTLGRWLAGHPPNPRLGLHPSLVGAYGAMLAGINLPHSTASQPAPMGCRPVISIGAQSLQVDGRSLDLTTLDEGLRGCRELPTAHAWQRFRGRVVLAADADLSAERFLTVASAAMELEYSEFYLLVAPDTPVSEIDPVASIAFSMIPPAAPAPPTETPTSPSGEANPPPRKTGKADAMREATSETEDGAAGDSSLLSGLLGTTLSTPLLTLAIHGDQITVSTLEDQWIESEETLPDCLAAIKQAEPDAELITLTIAPQTAVSQLVRVMDIARGTDDAEWFPYVNLLAMP